MIMNAEHAVTIICINISELLKCYPEKIKSRPIPTKVDCDKLTNFSLQISKNDKWISTQNPLKPMFNKRKSTRNVSVDNILLSEDATNISTNNPTIDDEELDLINFEQEQNTNALSSDSTPTLCHPCASIAPILVPDDPPSL